MKTRTYAAAVLVCMLTACSDDDTPFAPTETPAAADAAAPEIAATDPTGPTLELPVAAPLAVAQPLQPPSIDVDPPMRFDLPQLPRGWFERPTFPTAGHRRYTGLRIESEDTQYPGRIDQHDTEKLRAVITRNDGVSATSGADWRTGNTHVATVDEHGRVTARNPGRLRHDRHGARARGTDDRNAGSPGPRSRIR